MTLNAAAQYSTTEESIETDTDQSALAPTNAKTRKPGSGRPGVSRRKVRLNPIPRIHLVPSPHGTANNRAHGRTWVDQEYEQLCFDLLHEQVTSNSVGELPEHQGDVSPFKESRLHLRLPDRAVAPIPTNHHFDVAYFKRQRTSSSALPDAKRWCSQFACAYVEVLNGKRGIHQIDRWLTSRTSHQIKFEISSSANRPHTKKREPDLGIHSLHISEPIDSVIEGSCVVRIGTGEYRAMTFRFEGWDGRWLCTHLHLHGLTSAAA